MSELKKVYIVKNKWAERDDSLKDISFRVEWDLEECGLNWKYLAKVLVTKESDEWISVLKDFICSVPKKEVKWTEDIHYVYLNHLEAHEILRDLNINEE